MTSGSATISLTVMRGFRDENGSWKMICISRRRAIISSFDSVVRSTMPPPVRRNSTCPSVASIARRMSLPVVVLPQPDSPTRPSVSP